MIHDHQAEDDVVGACMLTGDWCHRVAQVLRPEDFHQPRNAVVFGACMDLWFDGHQPEVRSVWALLRDTPGVEMADVQNLFVGAPTKPTKQLQTVVECSTRRRLLAMADEVRLLAGGWEQPTAEVIDEIRSRLDAIAVPRTGQVEGLWRADEFLALPTPDHDWVVPGMLDRHERMVLVGPEGHGKSWVRNQIAVAAANGLHPFTMRPIGPVTTLVIDAENPHSHIRKSLRRMAGDHARAWVWSRPGGIDLRTRTTRGDLERVLAQVNPDLVAMGPLYKCFRSEGGRSDEVALEVTRVLDDLRTRHGFALVIEVHAPMGQHGFRDLRPFGSQVWMAWPEFGLKLVPDAERNPTKLDIGFFRGGRDERTWPTHLKRDSLGAYPWSATYAERIEEWS